MVDGFLGSCLFLFVERVILHCLAVPNLVEVLFSRCFALGFFIIAHGSALGIAEMCERSYTRSRGL